MSKRITITVDDAVYEGLRSVIGRRKISQFIESLVRPHVVPSSLAKAYREMARDTRREAEAAEWADATAGDAADETR